MYIRTQRVLAVGVSGNIIMLDELSEKLQAALSTEKIVSLLNKWTGSRSLYE